MIKTVMVLGRVYELIILVRDMTRDVTKRLREDGVDVGFADGLGRYRRVMAPLMVGSNSLGMWELLCGLLNPLQTLLLMHRRLEWDRTYVTSFTFMNFPHRWLLRPYERVLQISFEFPIENDKKIKIAFIQSLGSFVFSRPLSLIVFLWK